MKAKRSKRILLSNALLRIVVCYEWELVTNRRLIRIVTLPIFGNKLLTSNVPPFVDLVKGNKDGSKIDMSLRKIDIIIIHLEQIRMQTR